MLLDRAGDVISHPDAGKTTFIQKLQLFDGAGEVKASGGGASD
jgi:peptide subunit release factor RF-3